jgi:serine protease Do
MSGKFWAAVLGLWMASTAAGQIPVLLEEPSEVVAVLRARSPQDPADLRLIQTQLQRVIARVLPATASVEIGNAAGSGVVVTKDGLVLTAAHVIGRPGRGAWIELPDGRRLHGVTLGADHEADAGMIRLDSPPADLPFVPISTGPPLEPGEWVVTVGQPGGLVEDRPPPVRLGRVLFRDDEVLCTDCKLVGGDSGGPLFNMRGEVVGIHTSIGPMLTHNFHVPIASFHKDWDRLVASELWGGRYDELRDGNKPVLGVTGRSEGGRCVITQVLAGMPAERGGMESGDIVAAINGRAITSFDELSNIVAFKSPGDRLTLLLERGEKTLEISVRLARSDGSVPRERRRPRNDE